MKRFVLALLLILAPSFALAQVGFTGTANCIDDRDGDISASTSWESDIQGPLGVGSPLDFMLNEGTHIVLARCSDAAGNVATASQSVMVVVEDTVPPTLTITVEPTVAQAGISVTPNDAITGMYSLRVDPTPTGGAAYVAKGEGVPGDDPFVADWGTAVQIYFHVDHSAAVFTDGFETIVMRGVDGNDAPLFEVVLAGTASGPEAMARVYDAAGQLTTTPTALTQDVNRYSLAWKQDAALGLLRFSINAVNHGEMYDLSTDREFKELRLGAPVTTAGFTGFLIFDNVEIYPA